MTGGERGAEGGEGRVKISASSVSLFDVATCPKLGSTTELPPSSSGSAGIKESALGLTPSPSNILSHSRRCSALYRQPAKFLSRGKEGKRGKRQEGDSA